MHHPTQSICPFCTIDPTRIIAANGHAPAIMDVFPISWNPGNQTLIAPSDGKKAEVKLAADKSLVPNALHKKLFVKKDEVKADVVVEQQGNTWRIVGIV
jgi:hypothetical protein